jgi:hypothetical protein
MNEKLPVNNVNKIKREYPNKNNIEGSNKQPDNMLSMLQIFFFDQKILTDKSKKRVFDDSLFRPDYYIENINVVVEFDGPHHYQNPFKYETDLRKSEFYNKRKIFRIKWPYFFTLTKDVAKFIFQDLCQKNINQNFYSDEKYFKCINKIYFDYDNKKPATEERHVLAPGFHATKDTPASFCDNGIKRFLNELEKSPSPISLKHQVKHSIDLYLRDVKYNNDERKWLVIPENNQNFMEFMKLKPEKKYLNFFYKREANY